MLDAALSWCADIHENKKPYWLSFVGPSGTGKTLLAYRCMKASGKNQSNEFSSLCYHKSLIAPIFKKYWPVLLSDLRDGHYWILEECKDANLLFLDELALEHDPSGFGADKMCQILSGRVGKWTIITSNLSMEKIQQIDTRIASRMVRDGSVVVECNTVDYAMR